MQRDRAERRGFVHRKDGRRKAIKVTPEEVEFAEATFSAGHPLDQLVRLCTHCVDQYRERFEPKGTPAKQKFEFYQRLRTEGRFSVTAPSWVVSPEKNHVGFIVIGAGPGDIALPLRIDRAVTKKQPFVAVTTLYRLRHPKHRDEAVAVSPKRAKKGTGQQLQQQPL